jgi:ADP-heptose:LPS heptosyltransferase
LWIRFWAFGDALEAMADACNFKRRFPYVHLTFLSNPEYTDLFRVQPYVDDVIAGRKKPFPEWRRTLRKIRAGNYTWLISGHRGGRTSFLARFGRVSYRVGRCSLFFLNWNYHLDPESWFRSHALDVQDRSSPSIFASPEDRDAARLTLGRLPERRLLALIGAGNVGKMWKAQRWIELLRPLAEQGWGIVLNGHGPIEEAAGREIEDGLASPNVLNLVGMLNFKQMSGVAHACTLALGNDTGPLHLAALSGVPAMGLFSHPTSRSMGLRMPWFREFCAENHLAAGGKANPLEALPAEPLARAFETFAA